MGRKIKILEKARFMDRFISHKFFLHLHSNLPDCSPTTTTWPEFKYKGKNEIFSKTSEKIRQMHHGWRCRKYMKELSSGKQRLFRDKLEAEQLFETKALYWEQIPLIYRADYINLHTQKKWEARISIQSNS